MFLTRISTDDKTLPPQGIYAIINTSNGKRYVGSSNNIPSRRASHHRLLRQNRHHCIKLQHAWNKYGGNVFEFHFLESVEGSMRDLVAKEQQYLDSGEDLYNVSRFADRPDNPSRPPLSVEARARIGAKNSVALKGVKHSPERAAKAAQSRRGLKRSIEAKARMSAAQKGRKKTITPAVLQAHANRRGIPLTVEQRAKVALGVSRYVKTEAHRLNMSRAQRGTPKTFASAVAADHSQWGALYVEHSKAVEMFCLYNARKYTLQELASKFNVPYQRAWVVAGNGRRARRLRERIQGMNTTTRILVSIPSTEPATLSEILTALNSNRPDDKASFREFFENLRALEQAALVEVDWGPNFKLNSAMLTPLGAERAKEALKGERG